MNFARFCALHAKKFPEREFLIESWPSKGLRRSLTWRDFNGQADKLANYMIKECGHQEGRHRPSIHDEQFGVVRNLHGDLENGCGSESAQFPLAANDVKYAADVAKCKVLIR